MIDFHPFKLAVAAQFATMSQYPMFRTATERDPIWETYLGAFPEGTNPTYRERSEHDCNCCKSFIRVIGNVVAIIDGQVVSLWDLRNLPNAHRIDEAYLTVADALAAYVKAQPITDVFLHSEPRAGVDKNFEKLLNDQKMWEHFFVNLPPTLVVQGESMGSALNKPRAKHQVMGRGLRELTMDSVETILELIAQNSLYRGEEFKWVLTEFQKLKREYDKLGTDQERDLFVWSHLKSTPEPVAMIRNSAIGTLLQDLSGGMELEAAVDRFGNTMDPRNYKRSNSLITPKMVAAAEQAVAEMGLMSALDRRFAVVEDITVPNTLFSDHSARLRMPGNAFGDLAASLPAKAPKNLDRVETVTIEKFITDILPNISTLEILFENRLANNLVSLIAPTDPTAGRLFKWDNGFSWDYNGGVTDAIKERVKAAGGSVEGDVCCRLAWHNYDDLDFHMIEPGSYEISYGNKGRPSPSGGMLDVDMNAGGGGRGHGTREPVENIVYKDMSSMKEGTYRLFVRQYVQVERENPGFEVQIDILGTVYTFAYDKPLRTGENVTVAEFKYSRKDGITFLTQLPSTQSVKTVWGLNTQTYHKVNIAMLSPNHWDGQGVGSKHYFFMLEGCVNPDKARGFNNEFLRQELNAHRKTFEVLGARMKTPETTQQLSGLGFNSTSRNKITARVTGKFTRDLEITF